MSADSLGYFLTGASSDGGAQTSQSASLGNFRSSTEVQRINWFVSTPISNVSIVTASRANGVGVSGAITADGPNSLTYKGPSGTVGAAVTITNGQTKTLVDGTNTSNFVRVTRNSTAQLAGTVTLDYVDLFNNVIGMSNAPEAESAAGGNRYRAVMLRNTDSVTVSSIFLFVKPLVSTSVTTSAAQLSGAGAGTIQGAANAFIAWPRKGWVRIEDSGGTLREIVCYDSRTDTVLTIPAPGRGRLGTSATAGAATDKAWSVPGIRIAHEAASPLANGSVQTIANESTAPTGVTWSTAITAGTGISVGSLTATQQGAIWIHRELPAGVSAIAQLLNTIGISFVEGGVTYTETLAGMYRIADNDLKKYEIHIGVGSEPDLSLPPDETTSSLPYDTTYTIPVSTKVFVVVNYRNEYDLVSVGMTSTAIEVNGISVQINPVPVTPTIISWAAAAGGKFRLLAEYDYPSDANPGTDWKIYFTNNGVDPTTGDLLATEAFVRAGSVGKVYLDYTTAAGYANGSTGKVKIAVSRSSDSRLSALSAVATATAATGGATTPTGVIGQKKSFIQGQ